MEPYGSEAWLAIDALGALVDARLQAAGATLTMGGEPTYVAADNQDHPEWTVAALGPTKARYGGALARALARDLAPGALLVHGQGKWYPGEPLPRWMIAVHWRTDGTPLWRDPATLADPAEPGDATPDDARTLVAAIATALGLPPERAVPCHEDRLEQLWREARLPGGAPPEVDTPDGPLPADARAGLIAELDAAAAAGPAPHEAATGRTAVHVEPVGWALPLARDPGDDTWSTGRWDLRRGALYLVPGDSAVGWRLPLDALTWTPPPSHPERSQFEARRRLQHPEPATAQDADPPPTTALCVEVRAGHLYVFLPPLEDYEHAVELVGLVEQAAHRPIVVEGYPPPRDPRGTSFSITPDPGVIEVNIHPSHSWEELKHKAVVLYAAAAETGLTAERDDGRATGGGSHLTLGGPTPAESPFLTRPDLLRSMLTYWQHHPGLSYLFGGRFVGPTSQSPRIDEARHEQLYELEIAFAELEKLGPKVTPWQVDRALRNLLTDLTGNTHRAEFCIDKLFAPRTESGRLGVVELRGFEMPPRPELGLVQALLVRALVAWFCAEPYHHPLIRWGTELHDRFLLPYHCAADVRTVASDVDGFDPTWLEPFIELRFPLRDTIEIGHVRLEIRQAVEPWNVLGEEAGQGTARWVDSSVERVEVRAHGLRPGEAVACNGHVVPLHDGVAGVRFVATRLFNSLHPTIDVHAPLTWTITEGAHVFRPSAEYPRTLDLRRV